MNFNLDTQHKIQINHGFRTEEVTALIGIGTCDCCGRTRLQVRMFDLESPISEDEEPLNSTLCNECLEDDSELALVPFKAAEEAKDEEPEATEISERHCSACGNKDEDDLIFYVNDGYSVCCNEIVMDHSITYPNGTNLPGVMSTCKSEGRCYHE